MPKGWAGELELGKGPMFSHIHISHTPPQHGYHSSLLHIICPLPLPQTLERDKNGWGIVSIYHSNNIQQKNNRIIHISIRVYKADHQPQNKFPNHVEIGSLTGFVFQNSPAVEEGGISKYTPKSKTLDQRSTSSTHLTKLSACTKLRRIRQMFSRHQQRHISTSG